MVVNNKILISSILFLQEPKKMRKKRKGLKPRELKNEANMGFLIKAPSKSISKENSILTFTPLHEEAKNEVTVLSKNYF